MKITNNNINVKSYLFLIVMFLIMTVFFIKGLINSNIPLIILFAFSFLILGILIVLFEPKRPISIKYGDNILFNIEKENN